jgi:hypothetical protein
VRRGDPGVPPGCGAGASLTGRIAVL